MSDKLSHLDQESVIAQPLSAGMERGGMNNLAGIINFVGEATDTALIVCDVNLQITFANSAASRIFNIPEDLLEVGKSAIAMINFMHGRQDFGENFDNKALKAHIANIFKRITSGKDSQQTWDLTQSTGTELALTNLYSKDGYIAFLAKDQTKSAQHKKLLDIALKNGNAGYWSINFKSKKITFSDHLKSLFTEEEHKLCLEEGFWPLMPDDEVERVKAIWSDGFRSKKTFHFTYKIKLEKTGVRYFHTSAKPDFSASGLPIGVTCFASDVTEKHNMINELTEAKALSDKALHDRNNYLARMSHEIRTPMNGISGMADALLHNEEYASAAEQLNVIKASAKNLLAVLDETLEHARLSAGKVKITPVMNEPRDMLKSLQILWEKKAEANGTRLTLHIDSKLPKSINFDRLRMEQCVNNLVSNAVKFTQQGHIQIISSYKEVKGKPPVFIVAVKDTGIGITPEQQSRVFTAFEQADESIAHRFGGTGLGMPIAKEFIELMGGAISLKSEINVGSTFIITVPITPQEIAEVNETPHLATTRQARENIKIAKPLHTRLEVETTRPIIDQNDISSLVPRPEHTNGAAALEFNETSSSALLDTETAFNKDKVDQFKHLRVLVVEDNATNQVVIKALLSPLVDEIFFASNGVEALSTLETNTVDLVLMDIHMPIMDGIEATIAIRSSQQPWRDIGIIALTADPEYQQKRICRNIGMNSAISKPVSRRDLIQAFEEVLLELSENAMRAEPIPEITLIA